MDVFRACTKELCGINIDKSLDYLKRIDGLPKANVLKFYLEGGTSVVVRPSGTEPKMKIYVSVNAQDKNSASEISDNLLNKLSDMLK